jgi:calcineurin-like phosphoesterase family protein
MKIELEQNKQIFFTSDTHYAHKNICSANSSWESDTRLFDSLDMMNDTIVDIINLTVSEDDILFHLGDWSFGGFDNIIEFRNRINCKNIHLILGNHDHHITNNKNNVQSIFSSVNSYLTLDVRRRKQNKKSMMEKFNFVLFHYPIASWDGIRKGHMHLHGHCHLPQHLRVGLGKSIDVGMDGNEFKPMSMDEIVSILKDRPNNGICLPNG